MGKAKNRKVNATIKDIAKRLNVSAVTVSKALRGHPDISNRTKRLVEEIAEKIGYTPNFAARILSSRRSKTIGVVVPKIAHSFFASLIESIYDFAFLHDYDVALTVSQENSDREKKHIETLLAMRVDGLIVSVSQQTKDDSVFKRVLDFGVPLLFVDRVRDVNGASKVTVDDEGGAFEATERAIRCGYKKIAHVGGFKHTNIGRDRYAGFVKAMAQHRIEINPEWVTFGGFDEASGYKAFTKLCEKGNVPEFIFAVTYPVALGVYAAISEAGLKIPDNVDLICFGSQDMGDFIKPEISFIDQRTRVLAKTALELMLHHIRDDNFQPQEMKIRTKMVLRDTCVPKKWLGAQASQK